MKLTSLETRSIELLLPDIDDIQSRLRDSSLSVLDVTDREQTGVGCYTTIRVQPPLPVLPTILIRDFSFEHPRLPYGGSFVATIQTPDQILLEMVAFGGESWPEDLDLDEIREMIV
jgi:hypothetical protein